MSTNLESLRAGRAAKRLLSDPKITSVLDIGAGAGTHARLFAAAGKEVVAVDHQPLDIEGVTCEQASFEDYMMESVGQCWFDAIFCAHVLEHVLDPHRFLTGCLELLEPGGKIFVTVPPMKPQVVGGHVNLFNEGLLLYRLILAGFDCRDAEVGVYGYNITVVASKPPEPIQLPDDLHMDCGDIEKLAHLFPVPVAQGFDGRLGNINWKEEC